METCNNLFSSKPVRQLWNLANTSEAAALPKNPVDISGFNHVHRVITITYMYVLSYQRNNMTRQKYIQNVLLRSSLKCGAMR